MISLNMTADLNCNRESKVFYLFHELESTPQYFREFPALKMKIPRDE